MRMPSRSRSSFSRTMPATTDRVGARNAYTSSRLKASAAAPAPRGAHMLTLREQDQHQAGDNLQGQAIHAGAGSFCY